MNGSNVSAVDSFTSSAILNDQQIYLAWHYREVLASDMACMVLVQAFTDDRLRILPTSIDIGGRGVLAWNSTKTPHLWDLFTSAKDEADATPLGIWKQHTKAAREHFDAVDITDPNSEEPRYILIARHYLKLLPYHQRMYRVDITPRGLVRFWLGDRLHMVARTLGHRDGNPWFTAQEIESGKVDAPTEGEANA